MADRAGSEAPEAPGRYLVEGGDAFTLILIGRTRAIAHHFINVERKGCSPTSITDAQLMIHKAREQGLEVTRLP